MFLFSRVLARAPLTARRLALFAPATRACLLPGISNRRGIHTTSSHAQAPYEHSVEKTSIDKTLSSAAQKAEVPPNWRHPLLGFTADEASEFIYFHLPRIATEDDVNALLAKSGLNTAQVLMHYNLATRKHEGCYLRIAERANVDAAVAALSRLTLFGCPLQPTKLDLETSSPADVHVLSAGWLPSPTSNLTSRVVRPPITAPPELLAPLLGEQWAVFKRLEVSNPDLTSKQAASQDAIFNVLRNLYASFHKYDVVGITAPYKSNKARHGWCCQILFGNGSDARRAAALWREGFVKRAYEVANIYRGGPDVHKELWDYRQSLPKNMSTEESRILLELKYREMRAKTTDKDRLQRAKYPTPESAVGDNEDAAAAV